MPVPEPLGGEQVPGGDGRREMSVESTVGASVLFLIS